MKLRVPSIGSRIHCRRPSSGRALLLAEDAVLGPRSPASSRRSSASTARSASVTGVAVLGFALDGELCPEERERDRVGGVREPEGELEVGGHSSASSSAPGREHERVRSRPADELLTEAGGRPPPRRRGSRARASRGRSPGTSGSRSPRARRGRRHPPLRQRARRTAGSARGRGRPRRVPRRSARGTPRAGARPAPRRHPARTGSARPGCARPPVEVGVLGEEPAMDSCDLVHEEPAYPLGLRWFDPRAPRESARRPPPRACTSGSAPSTQETPIATSPSDPSSTEANPGASAAIASAQPGGRRAPSARRGRSSARGSSRRATRGRRSA